MAFHEKYGQRDYDFKLPKTKHELVYEILVRWWYCMEDWPPVNYDYNPLLSEQKLRVVKDNFNQEPELDLNGFQKVKELPGFPGMFVNSKGNTYDLRDRNQCPSFSNLKKKDVSYLVKLQCTAQEKQKEELSICDHPDAALELELGKLLEKVKKGYQQYLKKPVEKE